MMAKKAVSAAQEILQGNTMLTSEKIEVQMIDSSNINTFILEGWQ